ncbi:ribonuclease T [Hyphomicrobium sp.]|uniref:ribonuclease T2 family protein n=1 Tax=Hyphomicrobium sp. TaxID=82 RepID=UPI000F977C69|nr:ribonuclease T [Hyphomicrobium sp.]RUO97699.1 MAG: ribonuclease T [Hyphomicrobium sp.]
MLRPHLLLTLLVFVALGAYFAHVIGGQRTASSLPGSIVPSDSGTKGSSSGTTGTNTPVGGDKQAYNDDRGDDDSSSGGDRRENIAGQFDYYALVLSWSPTYCNDEGRDDETQCNRRDGGRYSFVLHGLWPQYESGYPRDCRTQRRPFVPDSVINSVIDIMPSRGLIIHEYRAHGTCSGLDPVQYFATAHRLFDRINIPERFRNPMEPQVTSAADVKRAFLQANPQFRADMITVVCGGAGGMLREVRLCLTKDGAPRTCGRNETKRNLCTANQVFVPPTRSTARSNNWQTQQPVQLPGPVKNGAGVDHLPGPR